MALCARHLGFRRHAQHFQEIETVYIPEEGRGTLCVSSQVGCTLTCSFCHTGTQKLVRNLTTEEIVGAGDDRARPARRFPDRDTPDGNDWTEGRRHQHRLMGMGEPLYNYDNVKRRAADRSSDGDGICRCRKRRITLSTSGVVPKSRAPARRSA
jgi:23S rRNA (adenine2503-C2)-methyltransferase